jgi:predicted enzyme related to lactoylglutathione lyase
MGKVIGLGGPFIKAADPKALAKWYAEKLGVNFSGTYCVFPQDDGEGRPVAGYNILSFFPRDSEYYAPSQSQVMLNLRVDGLQEWLEELRNQGVTVVGDMVDGEYGKFGWILDLEGNKVELWEPPKE